ncbi:MAG: MarC family protein [Sedimentisphaerales bacterium]|nr:MarC family protein [Sedimentisphaerales bacterium]
MFENIFSSFIPLFVAVDAIGVMPIFVTLTEGMERKERYKIIIQSMITAAGLAIGFVLLGKLVFKVLGIAMGDFMIAGGVVLFCLAIIDIVNPIKRRRIPGAELGAVPLGTPLIAGPAVLTTSILIVNEYGLLAAMFSIISNILLCGLVFRMSSILMKILGISGSKALSKVFSLLLAAIAVMLIRKGLMQFL